MEERKCLKCGHLNPSAQGGYLEACPQCGAIYTKVERALRERRAAEAADAARAEADRAEAAKKAERAEAKRAAAAAAAPAPAPAPEAAAKPPAKAAGSGNVLWIAILIVILAKVFWPSGKTESASAAAPAAVVSNSGWDGSVRQVKDYLRANLKDPSSLEVIEWSNVVSGQDGGYMVRVKYRAKNSYGGYVIEHKIFTLDAQGNVTGATAI